MLPINEDVAGNEYSQGRRESLGRFGERMAACVVVIYTASALLVSGWSGVIISSGDLGRGGPIGLFMELLKTAGLI